MTPLTISDQIDIAIAPCVATVHSGRIPFRCLNTGTTPFTFRGNTIIGVAELLPKEPIVNAIPFSKISNDHEYSHDIRCRQKSDPCKKSSRKDTHKTLTSKTKKTNNKITHCRTKKFKDIKKTLKKNKRISTKIGNHT